MESSYWHAVRNKAITPAEFDDLFFETALECSWNDLRLMARERGITPSMLAKDVLAKDMQAEEFSVAKVEVKARKEVVAEQPASVSAPARTRRRAPAERIVVEAPAATVEAKKAMSIPLTVGRPDASKAAVPPVSSTAPVLSGAFVSAEQPLFAPELSFEPSQDVLGANGFGSLRQDDELPGPPTSFRSN